ncbi:hypothetical protein NSK_005514 [Nannochloropsis salina CCMP1776]|uniref:Uncharacterized protein n=1 Tax=Nannochloropsis salina CCMP1776 TaxID=1027361 RepID=A0A4D9D3M6_9STRA|nr:hypothetical protein NSK_005514 [Nannochloropsis salina CCMP1776]|eukprot:TFJ83179.1 hypothetical protein NSK_005514 [Nannochloropsis salina CCMP1776]
MLCFAGGAKAMLDYRPDLVSALVSAMNAREGGRAGGSEKQGGGMKGGPAFVLDSLGSIVRDLLLCQVLEDTVFYWVHRGFHALPYLYQ